jgi:AraC-like DNA-binding protein
MSDPLEDTIALLKPRTVLSKGISGAGRWAVRYSEFGEPSFCTVIEGRCRLSVDGHEPFTMEAGDFILLPATPGFTMSGEDDVAPTCIDPRADTERTADIRHGRQEGEPDVRLVGGYFLLDSPDAGLLVSLLPRVVHIRGIERLATLVRFVGEEAREARPGRDIVLSRLVEILMVEALRAAPADSSPPGLLRGLSDPRLSAAIRAIHAEPAKPWTVAQLARRVAMSRSAFFEQFSRALGLAPMQYLISWRMALAKDLLRRRDLALVEIAERVGYGSTSAFSTAFSRHVGMAPGRYARGAA